MLKNTLIRTASALVGLVILFLVIFLDAPAFKVVVTILSLFMVGEVMHAFGGGIWGIICGVLSAEFIHLGILSEKFDVLMGAVFACVVIFAVLSVLKHKKYDFLHMAAMSFAVIYITFAMNYIAYIRDIESFGLHYLFIAFISAWISDTGAYFCGCLCGKHKLIPDISPKKTVEGAVGGILCSALGGIVFGLIEQFAFGHTANYGLLALVCGIGSVAGQFGDLVASMMKRKFNIKDFSNIMPGHGGITDRFDSVMLTAPYSYYMIMLAAYLSVPLLG